MLRRMVTPNRVLAAVLLTFGVLATVVAIETPAAEANDEPSHVRNARTLASGHLYEIDPSSGAESHQPPLYYGVLAGWQRLLNKEPTTLVFIAAPAGRFARPHFVHDTATDGAQQRYFDVLRLPGIVMGLATIVLTWLTIRLLTSDPWTPVVAASIVAFVPRFLFLAGVVNNDNLATVIGAVATFLAVWLVVRRPPWGRTLVAWAGAAGIVVGAAILTKVTAGVVVGGLVLALLLVVRHWRDRVLLMAMLALGVLVVSGWWLVRNQLVYGDPLANGATVAHLTTIMPKLFHVGSPLARALIAIPKGVWKTAWYVSGWNQFSWPFLAYIPFWLLAGIGLFGALFRRPAASRDGVAVLLLMVIGGAAAIWIIGLQTAQQQARIGFVGLPAAAGLIALGYEWLDVRRGLRFALPVLGLVGILIAIRTDVLGVFH